MNARKIQLLAYVGQRDSLFEDLDEGVDYILRYYHCDKNCIASLIEQIRFDHQIDGN